MAQEFESLAFVLSSDGKRRTKSCLIGAISSHTCSVSVSVAQSVRQSDGSQCVRTELATLRRQMTHVISHYPKLREEDGAVEWNKLLPQFQCIFSEDVNQWRPQEWVDRVEGELPPKTYLINA